MTYDTYFSRDDDAAAAPGDTIALLAGGRAGDAGDDAAPRIDHESICARHAHPDRALEALHAEYSSRLFAYALSMLRNREDAEDAVQTTFLNAYNALVDGRVPRQEASWLYRITRNACLNRIRTHARKPAGSLEGVDVASGRDVEDQMDQHLHAVALRSALERLPEQQRKAIVLRELQGASYAEIAEALDATQGAVESLIFRARRQLAASIRASAVTQPVVAMQPRATAA